MHVSLYLERAINIVYFWIWMAQISTLESKFVINIVFQFLSQLSMRFIPSITSNALLRIAIRILVIYQS